MPRPTRSWIISSGKKSLLILAFSIFVTWNLSIVNKLFVDYSQDELRRKDQHQNANDLLRNNTNTHQNSDVDKSKNGHMSRPLDMLREYKKFHSQEALKERHSNDGLHNQTFIMGFYSCPDSAGNRLHEFMNNLITAIANNYTIFWKFYDVDACRATGTSDHWCLGPNTIEKCHEVVNRASWIPSYDDWSETLNLTFGARNQNIEFFSPQHDVFIPNENKVWAPRELLQAAESAVFVNRKSLKTPSAKDRIKELYSQGKYYLYGLLLHEIFPFQDSVQPAVDLSGENKEDISIVLHSRHVDDAIDGSDVSKEIDCIKSIIKQHESIGTDMIHCKVLLVSDRILTIKNLEEWISQNITCKSIRANHNADIDEAGQFREHGPFALVGFFEDLALGAHANGGYIGASGASSSADLFHELYEYNRVVGNRNRKEDLPHLACFIPKRRKKKIYHT